MDTFQRDYDPGRAIDTFQLISTELGGLLCVIAIVQHMASLHLTTRFDGIDLLISIAMRNQ